MSNTHKQHSEKVDENTAPLNDSKETGLSRKSNNKMNFKLEYQTFSDVVQKARQSVEMHTMHSKQDSKVTEENNPFNEIKGSPRKRNDVTSIIARMQHKRFMNEKMHTLKRKKTTLLNDVEYSIKYLDYVNSKVSQAHDFYHKTLSEINDLKDGIKIIEGAVNKVQQSELLGEISGKVDEEDFDTMIDLSEDIVDNGKVILLNAHEVLKSFNHVVASNLKNLKTVSNAASILCSVSIEILLDTHRDLVYAIFKKVDDKINCTHRAECRVNFCYENLQPKLVELRCMCLKFFPLVYELVDMMFEHGFEFSIEN